jgi:hypothetical protein
VVHAFDHDTCRPSFIWRLATGTQWLCFWKFTFVLDEDTRRYSR